VAHERILGLGYMEKKYWWGGVEGLETKRAPASRMNYELNDIVSLKTVTP